MKRLLSTLVGIVLLLGLTPGQAAPTPRTPDAVRNVSVVNFAFMPKTLRVALGTTVKWTNTTAATTHTTTSDTGLWNRTLPPGGSFRRTFSTAGRFPYHCTIHPSMTGTIVVR
jgi:plastocyanin